MLSKVVSISEYIQYSDDKYFLIKYNHFPMNIKRYLILFITQMIEQETHKAINAGEIHSNDLNIKPKDDTKPQSQNNLIKSQVQNEESMSQYSRSSKSGENAVAQLDLGREISKLIKIYSKENRQDQLTKAEFEQLAQDLFSIVEPRQLTREELDNLFNLFEQKEKDPKKANAYKPPKTIITKEQLKTKAIENKGSLGFFKKK